MNIKPLSNREKSIINRLAAQKMNPQTNEKIINELNTKYQQISLKKPNKAGDYLWEAICNQEVKQKAKQKINQIKLIINTIAQGKDLEKVSKGKEFDYIVMSRSK